MKTKLVSALTEYDRRQSRRKDYNPRGLALYLMSLDSAMELIDKGKTPRHALEACFCDRLLDHCLKAIGEKP